MNKRILLLVSFCASFNLLFAQNIVVKPYPQDVEPTTMYIMWEADNSGTGYVDWGTSPFSLTQSTTSISNGGSGNSRIHTAQMTGLSPNNKYYYQVRMANGVTSLVYNVRTSPTKDSEEPIFLVAMSDMQRDGGNPNKFQEIVEQGVVPVLQGANAGDLSDKIDALLIPGDLVPTGGIYSDWRSYFFNPSDNLTPYAPVYPVIGNHETFLGGETNFKKYFQLPTNGTAGKEDEWWYKDISNVRVIGLNSTSGAADLTTQLTWLQTVLDDACADENVDFVFAELHHPFKSEMWLPGELNFTGEVILQLENFSTLCGKPSIHFFGHTHAYSRGQSRDHKHLWVNVATAGGNIDYWGEFAQNDYDEFVKSQDEYGFVTLDVEAGDNPQFTLKRHSRGDENVTLNNEVRDEIMVRRYEIAPLKPIALFPLNEEVNPTCLTLKSNAFYDAENDTQQAAHWQVATSSSNIAGTLVYESWKQNENWYNEVDTQANDDLTDEFVATTLNPSSTYYWRVRYRDAHLSWSPWSEISTFTTGTNISSPLTANLLINNGAESGTTAWTGNIESLTSFECGSVGVYSGSRMFAVGGVCNSGVNLGTASQDVDVTPYAVDIDQGGIFAKFGGYLRDYNSDDIPSMKVAFFDANGVSLGTTASVSNATTTWTLVERSDEMPVGTRMVRVVLEGIRNAGSDNDSYFDELSMLLEEGNPCSAYTPCPFTATLNNMMNEGALTVHTQDNILSTATVTGMSILSYKAGNEITLDPGFCTSLGVDFEALIEACLD